jgi:hypothetical protein
MHMRRMILFGRDDFTSAGSARRRNVVSFFTSQDEKQIQMRGMTVEKVHSDLKSVQHGFPSVTIDRPCVAGDGGDGIVVLSDAELERLNTVYAQAAGSREVTKFVPASGAGSRMFQPLLSGAGQCNGLTEQQLAIKAEAGDSACRELLQFVSSIRRFSFYHELQSVLAKDGLSVEECLEHGKYDQLASYILTSTGLDYANLPKGLIPFHHYTDDIRTPFAEHLVEAAAYVQDHTHTARVHFTVSVDYLDTIRDHIEHIRGRYEQSGTRYDVSYSVQKSSTDTIGVDQEGNPFRDAAGQLIFRPSGHGALLENLNDLQGDLVFLKNIDNVTLDRLKPETYRYKRALGGYLLELQSELFSYLEQLQQAEQTEIDQSLLQSLLNDAFAFAEDKLLITPPDRLKHAATEEQLAFLKHKLNRPLRVCGMVKNTGEPGGGPFWVEHADQTVFRQIIEAIQVNVQDAAQRASWESATHFNPVDLVCGVRDFRGQPFDLRQFTDPNTSFVVHKTKDGKALRSLELPGLWNGSMADWNTIFVEVPMITFNPVKTIFDLLRPEHQ